MQFIYLERSVTSQQEGSTILIGRNAVLLLLDIVGYELLKISDCVVLNGPVAHIVY